VGNNINRLVSCVESLQFWFWHNGLLLNPDKSEIIFLGTRQRLRLTQLPSTMSIAGNTISVSSTLKILGVRFDETLSFCNLINDIVRACNYHMQALRHIRRSMSADVAHTVGFSIVGSRVDYCNALLYGAGCGLLNKLQRVQNNLARIVCDIRRGERHSHELLRELHWLPVVSRINFKISLLCYKSFRHGQPNYLHTLLTSFVPSRCLRSSNHDLLSVGRSNLETAARRFSLAAPRVWNALAQTGRQAETVSAFKSALKTHFFRQNT
jgi:hypothetical protein